jgi:hypothetical protein
VYLRVKHVQNFEFVAVVGIRQFDSTDNTKNYGRPVGTYHALMSHSATLDTKGVFGRPVLFRISHLNQDIRERMCLLARVGSPQQCSPHTNNPSEPG